MIQVIEQKTTQTTQGTTRITVTFEVPTRENMTNSRQRHIVSALNGGRK